MRRESHDAARKAASQATEGLADPALFRFINSKALLRRLTLLIILTNGCCTGWAQKPDSRGSLPAPGLQWQGDLGQRFLASVGKRGFLFSMGGEGIEGYLYPFQVFHDLRVRFRMEGSNKPIYGAAIAQGAKVTPVEVTRFYAADGLRVRETLFVPRDQPVLMILYQVESEKPVNIEVAFRPDLDLMWPAGIGGQGYSWDDAARVFRIDEPSDTFHACIGSPDTVLHSDPTDRTEPWNSDRKLSFELRANPHQVVPVFATVGLRGGYDASALYGQALREYPSWRQQEESRYQVLRSQRLQIVTGDVETDQAMAWATVVLDQAEACNPDLGCGLVGGYGPTWPTRRPQYAWFFAGDGLLTTWALEAENAHDQVVRELDFARKYQNTETGAMWHEIAQSAAYVDWFHRYPYIYRHTDISPLYLLAMRNIWRSSADSALLNASWPSLEAAWRFCVSHVDAGDGLMVIPPEQSGVNENESDRTEKELPLELVWAAGADAFAELADALGKAALADEAHRASVRAKLSLQQFWDPARHYYFEGLLAGGRRFSRETASPVWGVWQGLIPPQQLAMVLDRLSEPAFRTPWGIRSIPADDPSYQPDSYAHGSVWPLTTSNYVLAALAAHRPEQASPMWQALVKQSVLGSPGHLPEVLSGASYRSLDVSVPEQTWSSAALITATVRGILGLDPDAPRNSLRFEPHLPPGWSRVTIANFQLGPRRLTFTCRQNATEVDLSVTNDGAPFELEFAPMLLSPRKIKALVNGKTNPAVVHPEPHDTHAVVKTTVRKQVDIRLLLIPW
jgi:glycogen debranching enzyme